MLSATCKYGIRAVIFIASRPDQSLKTGLKTIAEELNIPQPYLAKILQLLSRRKILTSTKGPHGGFGLLIPAAALTLMDIIESIDGSDFFDSCYVTGRKCNFDNSDDGVCLLHNDLRLEKIRLAEFFKSKTIEELTRQMLRSPDIRI